MKKALNRQLSAALLVCGSLLSAAPAQAQQLITNGGFEQGFTGWTKADQVGSDGTFFVQTGTTSPLNAFPVPAPPTGTQAAMTDAGAGGSHVLYQDFVVPAIVGSGQISFSLFINSGDAFFRPTNLDWAADNRTGSLNLNQQARVDILTTTADPFSVTAADILQNLYQTVPGDPLTSGYNTVSVNITSLLQARAGQTLRLRFAEVDNVSFFNFGVDNVSIQASPVAAVAPEPASVAYLLGGGVALVGLKIRRGVRGGKKRA